MTTPPTPHPDPFADVRALVAECERVNRRCIQQLGMGVIDLNAISAARAALAALRPQAPHPEAAEPVAAPVQPVARWIPTTERVPEPEVFVLCWDGRTTFVEWFGSKRDAGRGVTHWLAYELPPGATSDMHDGRRAFATPPVSVERARWLTEQDRADLERIEELFSDGEGWDLPKVRMQRLAELGVIRRTGGNYYAITSFGMHCLGREDFSFPLRTFAEVVEAAETAHHAALAQAGDKEQQP